MGMQKSSALLHSEIQRMLHYNAGAGLPDKKKTEIGVFSQIAKTNSFPEDQAKWLCTPENWVEKMRGYWKALGHDLPKDWKFKVRKNKNNGFEIREYVHEGLPGWVECFVRWDGSQVIFGFYLFPYAAFDPEEGDIPEPGTADFHKDGCECLGIEGEKALGENAQFLRDVWTKAPRAAPIVKADRANAEKDLRPNTRCWCGSGKKYKRCHGNLR
jgi:hypothetical protein